MEQLTKRRPGTKFFCELPRGAWKLLVLDGEVISPLKDKIIAICPEHAPRLIDSDGNVEILGLDVGKSDKV